MNHYQ